MGAMVEACLGITLLPSMATAMMKYSSRLKTAALNEPKFSRHVGLIKRTGETLSSAAFEYCQFTLQAMKKPRKDMAAAGGSTSDRTLAHQSKI